MTMIKYECEPCGYIYDPAVGDVYKRQIEGYTMLLQGEELSPDQEEYVEKILFNTQRLSGLVGNILLLSKLENQNIPIDVYKRQILYWT